MVQVVELYLAAQGAEFKPQYYQTKKQQRNAESFHVFCAKFPSMVKSYKTIEQYYNQSIDVDVVKIQPVPLLKGSLM
jgi:hypothetical protein